MSGNETRPDLVDLSAQDTAFSAWEDEAPQGRSFAAALQIDVDGFEGPLDLLLDLARQQKVDLAKISILALAEQYLEFIEKIRKLRIEIAADYLVMAAWLAYLKSRLLLPDEKTDEEPSGEEMAAMLAFRLKRLEAMRDAGRRLVNRNRLGQDFFARGIPEPIQIDRRKEYSATLYDLLTAYAAQRQRQSVSSVTISVREVWSLKDARDVLERMVGGMTDWTAFQSFLLDFIPNPQMRASVLASSFAATLELVREGQLSIRQEGAFAPLYMKSANRAPVNPVVPETG